MERPDGKGYGRADGGGAHLPAASQGRGRAGGPRQRANLRLLHGAGGPRAAVARAPGRLVLRLRSIADEMLLRSDRRGPENPGLQPSALGLRLQQPIEVPPPPPNPPPPT